MNDSNAKTMYETVPAAAELNKVPGFDPLKFLRRTKDTLKLDLPYQKLWFRMAHPNGRMRLTALRITEQMAIFEAKVFLDRSDAEPFSMSTAQQTTQDSRDFVKAAQNEALSQALTDAGFGIQMISAGAQADLMEKSIETPVKKAAEPPAGAADTAVDTPSYTKDTPMEDILQVMTLEQAQQVIVDDGICKGMTIAQVAEKRPVNLRYYLIPGKSKNNMVRAAAQLVLNSLQKAG